VAGVGRLADTERRTERADDPEPGEPRLEPSAALEGGHGTMVRGNPVPNL
jgi:hypothetical protein